MHDLQTIVLSAIGNMDIYLLDQVLKNRYAVADRLLDAGAGGGRNLNWFNLTGVEVYAIDANAEAIEDLKERYPGWQCDKIQVAALESIPWSNDFFDHIICAAVLHFAQNEAHFIKMFTELVRVLKPGGSLFIRVATDMGLETLVVQLGDGVYDLPDGTRRFLLTRHLLEKLFQNFPIQLVEPVKTVNVQDERCMMTLVIQKQPPG